MIKYPTRSLRENFIDITRYHKVVTQTSPNTPTVAVPRAQHGGAIPIQPAQRAGDRAGHIRVEVGGVGRLFHNLWRRWVDRGTTNDMH